ncbi:MAG: hypothetical protein Q9207_002039 [Kuettlingeria erythrocarpa]
MQGGLQLKPGAANPTSDNDEAIEGGVGRAATGGPPEEREGISFLVRYHLGCEVQRNRGQEAVETSGVEAEGPRQSRRKRTWPADKSPSSPLSRSSTAAQQHADYRDNSSSKGLPVPPDYKRSKKGECARTARQHSMSFTETQNSALTATDLLAYDVKQLVRYLKRNGDDDGGFDISGLVGVERLSKSRRDKLAGRLRVALSQLEHAAASKPFKIDELLARLTSVADKQDGSQSPDRGLLPSPAKSFESTESTPPPTVMQPKDFEVSSYHELTEDGGRPVCSIPHISHLLTTPTASYEAVLPWLSDHLDAQVRQEEIKTVFSRQFTRWWDFRKSQWNNRGIGDSEEGFSTFLEASRNRWRRTGAHAMVSASSFEETIRRQWQQKPASRQLPNGQGFSAYSEAVRRRLRSHHFTRPLQLKKNPQQQTTWTNWLEYLNFEQWRSEALTAVAESMGEETHQPWKRLLEASRYPSRAAMGSGGTSATGSSAVSGSTQTRWQHSGARTDDLTKELEATRADLNATNKMIDDFIRDTASYRLAETAAYYQRLRVKWAVEEARLMEIEMSQSRSMAKSDITADTTEKKKRRCDNEEEIVLETRFKKTRQ